MNLLLVSIAFASLSSGQAGLNGPGSTAADLTGSNRGQPQSAGNGEGSEANGDRRICRRLVTTGTNRHRRVCMTAEQWRQQQD